MESEHYRKSGFAIVATVFLLAYVPGAATSQPSDSEVQDQGGSQNFEELENLICDIPGPIQSGGDAGDTGVLAVCHVTAVGVFFVEYKYCYQAQTNGRPAAITTRVDTVPVDTHTFTTPYTGDGGCSTSDTSSYGEHSFFWTPAIPLTMRWDYLNGDFKIWIADIKVHSMVED